MPHSNHARVISAQALKTRRRIAMDYEALLKLTDQVIEERSDQNGQRVSHKPSRNQEDNRKSQKENLKIKPPLMSYEELLKLTDQIIEERSGQNEQRVSHKPSRNQEDERQSPKVKPNLMNYEEPHKLNDQILEEKMGLNRQRVNQEDKRKSQEENLKIKPPLMSYEELLKLTDQIIEEKRGLNGQRVSNKPPYDHEAERKSQRPVLKFKQTPMNYEAVLELAKKNQESIKTSAQVKKPKPLFAITQKRKLEERRYIKEAYERRDPEWVGSGIPNKRRNIANKGYVPNTITTGQTSSSKPATVFSKPPTAITKIKKPLSSSTIASKLLQKDVARSTAKRLRIEDDDSNMDDFLKDEKRHKTLTKKRRL